jgi:hypothetical protein
LASLWNAIIGIWEEDREGFLGNLITYILAMIVPRIPGFSLLNKFILQEECRLISASRVSVAERGRQERDLDIH